MSHFTRIRTQLRNVDVLKQAVQDLGYTVREGVVRGYGGQVAKADLVVAINQSFDVGFTQENEHMVLVGDFWGLKMDRQEFLDKVTQKYAYLTIQAQAEEQGWQLVEEEVQADGSVRLVVQRWT